MTANPQIKQQFQTLGFKAIQDGDLARAERFYRQWITYDPADAQAHFQLSMLLLTLGRLEEGWVEYEWRPQPQWPFPRWTGQPLNGATILMVGEQGFGDNFHFVRFAAEIAERGGKVMVGCREGIGRLLSTVPGVSLAVEPGQAMSRPDCHVSMMSLPGIFRLRMDNIPARIPYMTAMPDLVEKWRRRLDAFPNLKVGLVWAGNADATYDYRRSPGFEPYRQLLDLPGITFFSLQLGHGRKSLDDGGWPSGLIDLGPELTSFDETAAVMHNLDLVISSCTSPAHLAGALGRPLWLVLSRMADWRWFLDRDDSPWYPTARLFRQRDLTDWQTPLAEIRAALAEKINLPRPGY